MVDCLNRLRHDPIIRGHYQNHDIGHLGATGPHGRKGGMARRINEGDFRATRRGHLIGADVLGNATRLTCRDITFPNGIQQRGLAMINMAHDRDHRRP